MQTTYPGVYILEPPSGVHTIIGVATSIAAFIGYTQSGPDNTAVELFSWADFERNFGGLAADSELSYAVQQFFANGGTNCYVVRVPKQDAAVGKLVIGDSTSTATLTLEAHSSGSWSQTLTVEIDYNDISTTSTQTLPGTVALTNGSATATASTAALGAALHQDQWVIFGSDPTSTPYQVTNISGTTLTLQANYQQVTVTATTATLLLGYDPTAFNMTVTDSNSGQSESFPNLSMVPTAKNFVEAVVNDPDNGSRYITATQLSTNPPQITGIIADPPGDDTVLGISPGLIGLAQWLQGPPGTVSVQNGSPTVTGTNTNFTKTANVHQALVFAADNTKTYQVQSVDSDTQLTLTTNYTGSSAAATTASTATPQGDASFSLVTTLGGVAQPAVDVTLWKSGNPMPTSLAQLLRLFQVKTARALQAQAPGAQVTTQAVSAVPDAAAERLQITISLQQNYDALISFSEPSPSPPSGHIDIVKMLGLASPAVSNVAYYSFAHAGTPAGFQLAGGVSPADGTILPPSNSLIGDEAAPGPHGTFVQTGMYALDKVDLFNILCIPDATRAASGSPNRPDFADSDINAIYAAALEYCKKRRAFLLIDSPPDVVDVAGALNWRTHRLTVTDPVGHGAAYFPRLRIADPLNQNQLRSFASCGVVAGIYATEDGNRGVWKAPAGIETAMAGVQKLTYNLTDDEQGELNPIALNCFRNFPIYGPVVWGARTLAGVDAAASQWKYIPVRRFASFIEESLYRGLQWVVFEPNAEPLWAQIRLNVGSFMQGLFLQNAFQGQTPKDAYFVLCDATTTTQADIDAGIVNIIVGFAPLKPAEFVVLKLEQMAGQLAV